MIIGLAQLESVVGDYSHNLAKHLRFIELAAQAQIDYLIFPELSLSGYDVQESENPWSIRDNRIESIIQAISGNRFGCFDRNSISY